MVEAKEFLLRELKEKTTVVVATSGGPDSMTLLHLLLSLKLDIKIVCAHVNHKLREESDAEETMVEEFCIKNGISCEKMTIDSYDRTNIENQARVKRYAFFKKTVKKCQANYLLTAHHGDDLVETVLMRLSRGSNMDGYVGFREKIITDDYVLLRPLIFHTKDEILDYCKNNKIPYAIDKTNSSDLYTRNRYRKYILPKLKEEDKNIHKKFYKFSTNLNEYVDYINKVAKEKLSEVYQNDILNVDKFNQLDNIIKKNIVKILLNKLYKDDIVKITDKHTNSILSILDSGKPNITVNLPNNIIGIKTYNEFKFEKETVNKDYKIILNQEIILPNGRTIKQVQNTSKTSNYVICLNSKDLKLPLYIRNRKKGDKIYVKGMKGSKKIKDIFIDEKVPIDKRNDVPILVDSDDNIIWIAGIKKSVFDKQKEGNYDIILEYI